MKEISFELFEEEGHYPTEELLNFIEDYNNFDNVHEIIDLIGQVWWMPDWGITRKKPFTQKLYKTRVFTYYMSTGGWSGNESLIYSLKQNFIFWMHFYNYRRGGHYTFRFPVKND